MFGYVRPYTPELKMREYQYYRGVYCGLCRAMGRCTGQCSRLTLSYDLVFLALTRLALENGNPSKDAPERSVAFDRKRCLPHPFRRRPSLQSGCVTDYVACAAAVLGYHKIADDLQDEKGGKKWRARLLSPAARSFRRRAERHFNGLSSSVEPHMQTLGRMEKDSLPSADLPAAAFGETLGALFAYGLDPSRARIAHHIGYYVGRWLYFIDAIDDYEEDVKAGRPNPLVRLYGTPTLDDTTKTILEHSLILELKQAENALDLINVDSERCGCELSPLLYHMLRTALPRKTHEVLFPCANPKRKECRESEKST